MNKQVVFSEGEERLVMVEGALRDRWFDTVYIKTPWRQNTIFVFGKNHAEPRLTAWYGPPYRYSSIQWKAASIPVFLQPLHSIVCDLAGKSFNAVLLNLYRNGSDSMGWHSDNEPEMETACIASLSLGATRKMAFRNKTSNQKMDVLLTDNSLLLMEHFQDRWQHSIPKSKKVDQPRINLTFRCIHS
jgi:alkylated DNA repair dioxygenase AlkB